MLYFTNYGQIKLIYLNMQYFESFYFLKLQEILAFAI